MHFVPGDEYEGTWRDSKAEGRGVYVWKNGDRYDGEWKDNRKWGRGKKTFSSGDEYTGEWKVLSGRCPIAAVG